MKWSVVFGVILGLMVGIAAGFVLAGVGGTHEQAEAHATDAAAAKETAEEKEKAHPSGDADEHEVKAVCRVRTVALQRGDLPLPLTAFGTVTIAPEGVVQVVAPYECTVRKLLVYEGVTVAGDTTLVEVAPSPDTLALHQEALLTRAAAERDLAQVQQRLELRLATVQEMSQAQAAADLARLKAQTWEQRLADGGRCKSASVVARIGKLLVRVGQLVPMGTLLVELHLVGGLNEREIRIGLDPADAARVKSGQAVNVTTLRRTVGSSPAPAMLLRLATQVTPETRLLDAIVSVPGPAVLDPGDAGLVPGEAVRVDIPLTLPDVLIVPRQALVRSDAGWVVFTAVEQKDEHHAVRHRVKLVAENRSHAAIAVIAGGGSGEKDDDLKPGTAVITEGNAEVVDGMELKILGGDAP